MTGPGILRRHLADVLVAVVVLLAAAPTVQLLMAHQSSRLAFTAAVVDDGTLIVDRYGPGLLEGLGARESRGILQVDYAVRSDSGLDCSPIPRPDDCHLYSDKAPGQPLLAAPFYAVARAAGAEPGVEVRYFDNYTLWWVSLWSSAIPAAILAVLMRRFCLRITGDATASSVAAVGMSLGTLLLPFATVLFSHVLAALLGYACYVLAEPADASARRLALSGALGGAAVLTEYATVIVVAAVGVQVLRRHGAGILAYVSGGAPALALLGVYNAMAWGDALSFSYDHSGGFGDFHEQGVYGINVPDLGLTWQILAGERGLLTMTPVVAVGIAGLILLAREARTRAVGITGLVVFGLFVCVQGGWFSVTAGASPGPRYVVASLPFVAVGVARVYRAVAPVVILTILVGGVIMFAAIFTNPLAQPRPFEMYAAGHWFWRVINGSFGDNLLTPLIGKPWGQLAQLTAVLGAVTALFTVGHRPEVISAASETEPSLG